MTPSLTYVRRTNTVVVIERQTVTHTTSHLNSEIGSTKLEDCPNGGARAGVSSKADDIVIFGDRCKSPTMLSLEMIY